jgi:hypothetical protein
MINTALLIIAFICAIFGAFGWPAAPFRWGWVAFAFFILSLLVGANLR